VVEQILVVVVVAGALGNLVSVVMTMVALVVRELSSSHILHKNPHLDYYSSSVSNRWRAIYLERTNIR
jgi:hypothetical protein